MRPWPTEGFRAKGKEVPSFKTSRKRKHRVASPNRTSDELAAQFTLRLLVSLWSSCRLPHRIVDCVPTFRKTQLPHDAETPKYDSQLSTVSIFHLHSSIKRDQLDITCFIISLFNAQHVSDVNTSILRSLRLMC